MNSSFGMAGVDGVRTPLTLFGGKQALAAQIVPLLMSAPASEFGEAFCGSCAVLFRKPATHHPEYINDADRAIINFWKTYAHPKLGPLLVEYCERNALYSEELLFDAVDFLRLHRGAKSEDLSSGGRVRWAWALFQMSRTAYARQPIKSLNLGAEAPSSLLRRIDELPAAARRIQQCIILRRDGLKFLDKFGKVLQMLIYLDPPYEHTNSGRMEGWKAWGASHFIDMLDLLAKARCYFALSHYRDPTIDGYADQYGWQRLDLQARSRLHSDHRKVAECVYHNIPTNQLSLAM